MIEGSGSGPLTNGSGSRRPKIIWIGRIRIRNTAWKKLCPLYGSGSATLHKTICAFFTDPGSGSETLHKTNCALFTELNEGGLAGGHLHDGAAQGPDVGRGAVPTLPFVDHLHKKRYITTIRKRIRDPDPGWTTGSYFRENINQFFGLKYQKIFMRIRDRKSSDPG